MRNDVFAGFVASIGGQNAAAEMFRVSQPAVHKWIVGKSKLPIEIALLIADGTAGEIPARTLRPDFFGQLLHWHEQ